MYNNYLKKIILSNIMLLLMSFNYCFAQEYKSQDSLSSTPPETYVKKTNTKSGMEWGFFMGPNWSLPSGSAPQLETGIQYENVRERARTTFYFGFKFNFHLENNLSVEFNALFNSQGQKTEFSGYYHELGYSDETEKYTDVLSYFVFPLTLNYYLTDNIYIKGGVYGATLAGAQRREGGVFGNYVDIGHLYKSGDFGVTAGIGAESKVVFLEWRYSRGLVDVTFDDASYYNQNVQLVVGFKFGG